MNSNNNISKFPCPICKEVIFVVGKDHKGKTIGSCGHSWKFAKTRSQKELDRKYIRTEYGLELVKK